MADISYTPTTWANGSTGGTPIDATKLNNIETGISNAVAAIGPNDTTADGTLKAQIDALGESVSDTQDAIKTKIQTAGNEELFLSLYEDGNGPYFVIRKSSGWYAYFRVTKY